MKYVLHTDSLSVALDYWGKEGNKNYSSVFDQLRKMDIDPTIKAYNPSGKYHFADDSVSACQSLVPWILEMPISVYVAVSTKNIPIKKEDKDNLAYQRLFPEVVKPLVMKFSKRIGTHVLYDVNFENLSAKKTRDTSFFKEIIKNTPSFRGARVHVVAKNEDPLSFLPDYFLGFIHKRLTGKQWAADSLKLLADKIGLLLFLDEGGSIRYERGEKMLNFLGRCNDVILNIETPAKHDEDVSSRL